MSEQICPGMCNKGWRRAVEAYEEAWREWADQPAPDRAEEPTPPGRNPRPGEPIWCPSCTASIRRCLADLDELVALRLTMTDGFQTPGQVTDRVRAAKTEPASPSPAQDDLDDLLLWLHEWEVAYRESQGWPHPPYRGVNAPALTSALAWLGSHLDAILAHPDLAGPFGQEVFVEHGKLQAVTHTRPPMRHKPLPCPRCRRRSLFLHDDETVRCHNDADDCRRVMTAREYEDLEAEADQQVAS